MTQGGSEFIKIKIKIETGEAKVKDEKNNKATEMTQAEVDLECQGKDGLELIGEIFRCQFNPTCYYYYYRGRYYKICR